MDVADHEIHTLHLRRAAFNREASVATLRWCSGSRKLRRILELREPDRFQFPGSLAWSPDGHWVLLLS